MEVNPGDGRTRAIRVTDKFIQHIEQHKAVLQAAYKEQFLVIFKADQAPPPTLSVVRTPGIDTPRSLENGR